MGTPQRLIPGSWIERKLFCLTEEEAQSLDWALHPRIPDGNSADGHPGLH